MSDLWAVRWLWFTIVCGVLGVVIDTASTRWVEALGGVGLVYACSLALGYRRRWIAEAQTWRWGWRPDHDREPLP